MLTLEKVSHYSQYDGRDNFYSQYAINDAYENSVSHLLMEPFIVLKDRFLFFITRMVLHTGIFFKDEVVRFIPNCTQLEVLGIIPGIIGMFQANETIKIITGIGKILSCEMLMIDFFNMNPYKIIPPLNGYKEKEKSFD